MKDPVPVPFDILEGCSKRHSKAHVHGAGSRDHGHKKLQRACTRHQQKSEFGPVNRHGCHHHCTGTRMHQKENDSFRV